jgi:uncharacterized SAM-binding protein YcdF (DUF218 family)
MAYKFLAAAIMPINLVLLLGAAALILAVRKKARAAVWTGAAALVLLLLSATPAVSHAMVRSLERRYLPVAPRGSPSADAIVVLGGCLESAIAPRLSAELTDASDRILHAARLYRAGKAPVVVASGGVVPWMSAVRPEAEEMAALLAEWGVLPAAILVEGRSRTTRENAVETERILRARGTRSILLVTSAIHMPRALAAFRMTGLSVTPSPTDYLVADPVKGAYLDSVPSADSVRLFHVACWEQTGLLYYWLRGWTK